MKAILMWKKRLKINYETVINYGKIGEFIMSEVENLSFYLLEQILVTKGHLADLKYDGEAGNFRIISRKEVSNFCLIREQLRFFGGLVDWMGFPTVCIEVQHDSRL